MYSKGPWIVAVVGALAVAHCVATRPLEHPPGVVAPNEAMQTMPAAAPIVTIEGHELTPLAQFAATVRILGRERYRIDRLAAIAPFDLAVGWGPMSDSRVRVGAIVTLAGRLVDVRAPDGEPRTSLGRTDSGAGACEILLLESLRIERGAAPVS
jgi:hypothetical protein